MPSRNHQRSKQNQTKRYNASLIKIHSKIIEGLTYFSPRTIQDAMKWIAMGHGYVTQENFLEMCKLYKINISLPGFDEAVRKGLNINNPVFEYVKAFAYSEGNQKGNQEGNQRNSRNSEGNQKTADERKQNFLPKMDDVCLGISATANSAHEPAPYTAMQIMGMNPDVVFCRIGTAELKEDHIGFGVPGSGAKPLHDAVIYNPILHDLPFDWLNEGRSLHTQLDEKCNSFLKEMNKIGFTKLFLHGCHHYQYEHDAILTTHKISWGLHEQYLHLYQVIQAYVGLKYLNDNGNMSLKLRVFQQPTTQYFAALMGMFFEKFELIPVQSQLAQYVLFLGTKFRKEIWNKFSYPWQQFATSNPVLYFTVHIRNHKLLRRNFKTACHVGQTMKNYDNLTYHIVVTITCRLQYLYKSKNKREFEALTDVFDFVKQRDAYTRYIDKNVVDQGSLNVMKAMMLKRVKDEQLRKEITTKFKQMVVTDLGNNLSHDELSNHCWQLFVADCSAREFQPR
jgi:uncharacterized protein YlbG (UPF0298 family)